MELPNLGIPTLPSVNLNNLFVAFFGYPVIVIENKQRHFPVKERL